MIRHVASALLLLLAIATGDARAQVISPTAPPTPGPSVRPKLEGIRSWGYQLQRIDPERVARSPYDLMVVDYSRSGKEVGRLTPADIRLMQTRPDGGRRIVLAYLSIGEAEDYRYYWRDDWVEAVTVLDDPDGLIRSPRSPAAGVRIDRSLVRTKTLRLPKLAAPAWLGRENESWPSNFFVRYWDPGWQSLIFGDGDSYLARLLAAGFDGVYLDRIDTFQEVGSARPSARQDMVRFVTALAERARRTRSDFLVVPQNGEQLLAEPGYLAAIDAVAKEDLLYGDGADNQRNPIDTVGRSMRWLAPAVNRGLPVLVVEYLRDAVTVDPVRADILGRGFVPYFGARALDRLVLPEDLIAPPPVAVAPPAAVSEVRPSLPPAATRQPAKNGQTPAGEKPLRRTTSERPATAKANTNLP